MADHDEAGDPGECSAQQRARARSRGLAECQPDLDGTDEQQVDADENRDHFERAAWPDQQQDPDHDRDAAAQQ